MTVIDARPPVLPGGRAFEHPLEELVPVGVNLAPEQLQLFDAAVSGTDEVWAMTLGFIPDPEQDMEDTKPMDVWGANGLAPLLVPRLVLVTWPGWPDLDVLYPGWDRFPSLPGHPVTENGDADPLQAFRLWNLWPLDESGRLAVLDAYQEALESLWVSELQDYLRYYTGACSACEASMCGSHEHVDDPLGLYGCEVAKDWVLNMLSTYVHHEDRTEYWRAPPEGWLDLQQPVLGDWERLQGFSANNAWASLRAVTDPDAVRQDERRYSPWLWSS